MRKIVTATLLVFLPIYFYAQDQKEIDAKKVASDYCYLLTNWAKNPNSSKRSIYNLFPKSEQAPVYDEFAKDKRYISEYLDSLEWRVPLNMWFSDINSASITSFNGPDLKETAEKAIVCIGLRKEVSGGTLKVPIETPNYIYVELSEKKYMVYGTTINMGV